MRKFLYAFRRFFIIGTGGYTRYSDYPDFDKKVAEELVKLRERRIKDGTSLAIPQKEL